MNYGPYLSACLIFWNESREGKWVQVLVHYPKSIFIYPSIYRMSYTSISVFNLLVYNSSLSRHSLPFLFPFFSSPSHHHIPDINPSPASPATERTTTPATLNQAFPWFGSSYLLLISRSSLRSVRFFKGIIMINVSKKNRSRVEENKKERKNNTRVDSKNL